MTRATRVVAALLAAFLLGAPAAVELGASGYLLTVATRAAVLAIAAVSLQFILGFGGLVSFGHAAMVGNGAYAVLIAGDADAAVVLRDIASGLAHAHSRGIVHRDVKPGNVLLRQVDGRLAGAALADFGIARFAEATRTTSAATILGTVRYLSPEQVEGGVLGGASDVYSLGLVLIQAATGRVSFPGSVLESAFARLSRDPEIPASLPPRLAAVLAGIVERSRQPRP